MKDYTADVYSSRRSPVYSTRGMVATSQPLAGAAGVRMLDAGGTAADAALAAAASLQVTQACSTGLGGDAFFLYYDTTEGRVYGLNGSGRAPANLSLERLASEGLTEEIPDYHPHTVTVPGAPRAWQDLHDRFGLLPRAAVLAPAVDLAGGGFPISPLTAGWWAGGAQRQLSAHEHGHELMIDGRGPVAGEILRLPTLASSLRAFAEEGAAPFYTGRIAEAIVAVLDAEGGVMTMDDLAAHESEWVEPIEISYRGTRILECPPNGHGLAALIALNVLRHLELPETADDRRADSRARGLTYHFMIEAMRVGLADAATYVADPAFASIPVSELLGEAYGEERARSISPDRPARHVGGRPDAGSDTVYFCAVDAWGNACSFINSNYMGFGTGIVPEGCGFSLQNRGKGFSLDPEHRNRLEPGKRPYHTIIPGMALRADGSLLCPFGVMGGMMQPQGHLQIANGLIDDGLDPQSALDRARFMLGDGDADGSVLFESEADHEVSDVLAECGHRIVSVGGRRRGVFGLGQVIVRDIEGVLSAGSDPRGDGAAIPSV